MKNSTVNAVRDVGVAINLAAGHVGEMADRATRAAGEDVGCTVASTVGKAIESAGKAWSDTAVDVGHRDAARLTDK